MQVFKAYFKIIKKNLPQMFIYLGIFAGMSVAFANLGVGKMTTEFVDSKPGIAVFSNDDDTVLMDGLLCVPGGSGHDRSQSRTHRMQGRMRCFSARSPISSRFPQASPKAFLAIRALRSSAPWCRTPMRRPIRII